MVMTARVYSVGGSEQLTGRRSSAMSNCTDVRPSVARRSSAASACTNIPWGTIIKRCRRQ